MKTSFRKFITKKWIITPWSVGC